VPYILPFAAGGFIYLAGSDLIPELHRESSVRKSIIQLAAIFTGIMLMFFISLNHSHQHAEGDDHPTEQLDHDHNH
jgi:zinc and cadmium transporter